MQPHHAILRPVARLPHAPQRPTALPMSSVARQRDLWMSYIAQAITTGKEPPEYPNINDKNMTGDGESMTHEISMSEKNRISKVVNRFLPCAPGQVSQAIQQILELCSRRDLEKYPYDLLICADQVMMGNDVPDEDRIANVVCERILSIYDRMIEEEHDAQHKPSTSQDRDRTLRLSLRRLLVRICADSDVLPESLFVGGIELPPYAVPVTSGGFSDIYRLASPRGSGFLALKFSRVFQKASNPDFHTRAIAKEAIVLCRLEHKNVLKFLGLYKERRMEFEVTSIVSPWMDNGNVSDYLTLKVERGTPVPRIRWIYEIACGLKYLHDESVVHGSLHGRNILVDVDMHIRIAGFGLSDVAERTTTSGIDRASGNPVTFYTAPELTGEGAKPNFPSDVWSFGCLCLLIWTGEQPYAGCRNMTQMVRLFITRPDCTPENSTKSMDTFYADDPQEHARGALLKSKVALPCWSREPEARPRMAHVEEILSSDFGDHHIR